MASRWVKRLILATLAIVVLGATLLSSATGAHSRKSYAPKDCHKPVVEPRRIVFACADAGLKVSQLHWTKWRHLHARGKGVLKERQCDPICLGGPFKRYPVRIRLRKVERRWCGGKRVPLFRKAILSFPHKRPPDADRVHENTMPCSAS